MALAIVTMACKGITQGTQTPLPPSPTSLPLTTETPIPAATETPITAAQTGTSTAIQPVGGQVTVMEMNSFKDESDYWYFYGLVRNDTEQTISDLQIEVKLLDSTETEIYTYTTRSILNYLAPGETSPFSDYTTAAFPDGKTMQASVVGSNSTEAINRATLEYRGITMWTDDYNNVYLSGEVFNANTNPVKINSIGGSLTDDTGKLVTASYAYPVLGYIELNGSSPFTMMFDAPLGQAAALTRYNFYSDALSTDPATTYDISLSDKNNDYQDSNGDTHLVGSVTNNNSEPMNIYLVAGIYDKDGNCVDASSIYLPVPLNPGMAFPYDLNMWGPMDYAPAAYETASDFKIIVDWASTHEASPPAYTLTTQNDTNAYDGSISKFNGTVINNSGRDLTVAIVIIALYNKASGELIATNYSYVTDPMTNNASGTYEVYVYPPNEFNPANVNIVITALGQ
jgi:hypothetical protein